MRLYDVGLMGLFKSIYDWLRYERLHHYPELAHLPRDVALARLEAVGRQVTEERAGGRRVVCAIGMAALTVLSLFMVFRLLPATAAWFLPIFLLTSLWGYLEYRITRRRVRALILHERDQKQPEHCLECGYDLRGSPSSTCPECGFDALAKPEGYE